jgi:hypothetical protein
MHDWEKLPSDTESPTTLTRAGPPSNVEASAFVTSLHASTLPKPPGATTVVPDVFEAADRALPPVVVTARVVAAVALVDPPVRADTTGRADPAVSVVPMAELAEAPVSAAPTAAVPDAAADPAAARRLLAASVN